MKKLRLMFFPGLIALALIVKIWPERQLFTAKTDVNQLKSLYQRSQFAEKTENRQAIIEDWDLYAYAGYEYITSGRLDKINVEHPPLGKYVFGLSLLLFNNPLIVQIPLAFVFLLLSYLIADKVLKNKLASFIVPIGLLNEGLVREQISHSLLGLFEATAAALFIWLVISKKDKTSKQQLILGVILGMMASIKYPAAAMILGLSYGAQEIINSGRRINIKKIALVSWSALLVFVLSYWPLLISQGINGWIHVQTKAIRIHLSHVPEYPLLAPVRVMLLNQWPVWFDSKKPFWPVSEWRWSWILLMLSLIYSPAALWIKRKKIKPWLTMILFVWGYFIFINTRLFFPRYLLILLPYLYLLLLWEIKLLAARLASKSTSGPKI
jgi:predicted membrane-bound dolichyl-phosphate-mannose-protein mannosyltransferase